IHVHARVGEQVQHHRHLAPAALGVVGQQEPDSQPLHIPTTWEGGGTRRPHPSGPSACASSASYSRRFGTNAFAQSWARWCESHSITASARNTPPHVARRSTSSRSQSSPCWRTTDQ